MSIWFPTEFGEDYRTKTLWLRAAAIISTSIGNVLLVTRHAHPYSLLVGALRRVESGKLTYV